MSNEVADGIRGDEAIEVELSDESGFTQIDTANCPPPEQQGEYLQDAEVTAFVDFLKGLLGEGGKLRHAWRHARDGYDWQCEDLLDAARRYHFTVVEEFRVLTGPVDFQSLAANALVLNDLKRRLDAAVSSCNDVDARAVAKDIQLWGGTDIRGKKKQHGDRYAWHRLRRISRVLGSLSQRVRGRLVARPVSIHWSVSGLTLQRRFHEDLLALI